MAIEGSLELFQLPEILQVVAAQNKTGILTVQGENDIVAISFKDGQVVAADALNQTVEDGLGQVLASQGLVSPTDFAEVSQEHEASGTRLLDILISKGLLDRAQLLEALRTQTYQLLLQLLRWQDGEFKFYTGDEVAFEEGFYAISVEELLIRSVTDLGEDGQLEGRLPDLKSVYERVPDGPILKVVGVDGNPELGKDGVKGNEVWLEPDACDLFDRLDGNLTAGEVARSAGIDAYRALFTLYQLLGAGAVRLVLSVEPTEGAASHDLESDLAALDSWGTLESPSSDALDALPETQAHDALPPVIMPDPEDYTPYGVAPVSRRSSKRKSRDRSAARARPLPTWGATVSRLVAAAAIVVLLIAWWGAPRRLLLPFSAASDARLLENQRRAQLQRIDRSARTFFLVEGHYPDELRELVDLDLLPSRALRDPEGRALAYHADDVSYELQPVERGRAISELVVREAITGDFLLDAEFLDLPDGDELTPLILLD
jgi:hypothetical protein